jgi:dolichol-phosphate mannosyltransferase
MTLISFVLPVYNEGGNLRTLYERLLLDVIDRPEFSADAELLFINDGSRDDSLEVLRSLAATDARVHVIDFSRNFGHQLAVTAGLDYARGDAVIVMDTDLQDPPRVALELLASWRDGNDVVYAQRRSRKDSVFKRMTASVFYRFLSWAAEVDIPHDTGDFRLLDRKVVDAIKRFPERSRFIRGMVASVGFRQAPVLFDRDERLSGTTGYPLRKMIRFAADGILSFSTFPLRLIRIVGWTVATLSVIGIIYVFIGRLFFSADLVPGWAFTVIAILFVGGVQIIMLSVLGSYIGRIYSEVQGRPLYIVAEEIGALAPRTPPAA